MRHFFGFVLCFAVSVVLVKAIWDFIETIYKMVTEKEDDDGKV